MAYKTKQEMLSEMDRREWEHRTSIKSRKCEIETEYNEIREGIQAEKEGILSAEDDMFLNGRDL